MELQKEEEFERQLMISVNKTIENRADYPARQEAARKSRFDFEQSKLGTKVQRKIEEMTKSQLNVALTELSSFTIPEWIGTEDRMSVLREILAAMTRKNRNVVRESYYDQSPLVADKNTSLDTTSKTKTLVTDIDTETVTKVSLGSTKPVKSPVNIVEKYLSNFVATSVVVKQGTFRVKHTFEHKEAHIRCLYDARLHTVIGTYIIKELRDNCIVVSIPGALEFISEWADDDIINMWKVISDSFPVDLRSKVARVSGTSSIVPAMPVFVVPKEGYEFLNYCDAYSNLHSLLGSHKGGFGVNSTVYNTGLRLNRSVYSRYAAVQDTRLPKTAKIIYVVGGNVDIATAIYHRSVAQGIPRIIVRVTDSSGLTSYNENVQVETDEETGVNVITGVIESCMVSGSSKIKSNLEAYTIELARPAFVSAGKGEWDQGKSLSGVAKMEKSALHGLKFTENYQRYMSYLGMQEDKEYFPSLQMHNGIVISTTKQGGGYDRCMMMRIMITHLKYLIHYTYHGIPLREIPQLKFAWNLVPTNFVSPDKAASSDMDHIVADVAAVSVAYDELQNANYAEPEKRATYIHPKLPQEVDEIDGTDY